MKSFRKSLFLLCALMAPALTWGQVSDAFEPHLNAYDLREILAADAELWMASNGGSLKLGGTAAQPQALEWTAFPRRSSGGPAGNDVVTVARDATGLLWFGSASRGVSTYDPVRDRWSVFEEVPDSRIRVIRTAGTRVFIGTQAGLSMRLQPQRTDICNDINPACIVPSFTITDFASLGDTVWVGTQAGLGRFNGLTWDEADSLPPGSVGQNTVSLAAHQGRLWELTETELRRLDGDAWTPFFLTGNKLRVTGDRLFLLDRRTVHEWTGSSWMEHGAVPGMDETETLRDVAVRDGNDTLWLTTNRGLVEWTPPQRGAGRRLPPGPAIPDNHNGLAVDGSGSVWVGNREGLMQFDGADWSYFAKGEDGLDGQWIFAVAADGDRVSVGHCCCDNPPACRVDIRENQEFAATPGYDAWSLDVDSSRRLWGGTNSDGAFVLEHVSGDTWERTLDLTQVSTGGSLRSDGVRAIAASATATYFGHTLDGVSVWQHNGILSGGSWSSFTTATGLLDNSVASLTVSGQELWVGTSTAVHRILGSVVLDVFPTRFFENPGDLPRIVRALVVDDLGNVWAGTNDGVLFLRKGERRFQRFSQANSDMPSDNVLSGALHPDGSVWFGCVEGVVRIDPFKVLGEAPGDNTYTLYPNPFNPRLHRLVTLGVAVGGGDLVDTAPFPQDTPVDVLDAVGQVVGTFSFTSEWEWDGKNLNGDVVAPGLYMVRARPGGQSAVILRLGVVR